MIDIKLRKLTAVTTTLCMVMTLAACTRDDRSADITTAAVTTEEGTTAEADSSSMEAKEPSASVTSNGEVSIFYASYEDPYISSVRAVLGKNLEKAGIAYQEYDSGNSQETQNEQVSLAIADGTSALIVNVVDSGSDDAAGNIMEQAKTNNIPVVFFNRPVSEEVVSSYDKCVFVGTEYEIAGHMQGRMIGDYLIQNYDRTDLNEDGVISYVMFKGQEGNAEAEARTQFSVEEANVELEESGKPALSFYDSSNMNRYLVDPDGTWSAETASGYMQTILSQYNEENNNMVELVIANNDEMAMGAVQALQNAGYNLGDGDSVRIPVFGIDATDAAKKAVARGMMAGTVRQDAKGMADTIAQVTENYLTGADTFSKVDTANVVGTWRVNIPYRTYTGEE